jgi:hypothetical protein
MEYPFIYTASRTFIVVSTEDISPFDDSVNALRADRDRFVTIMRGKRMRTWEGLVNEVAATLQFPWYFGGNWNALDECINSLEWLHYDAFVIAITNSEIMLSDGIVGDRLAFGKLLLRTCQKWSLPLDEDKAWGRPAKPFHIIMHFEDEKAINMFGDIF